MLIFLHETLPELMDAHSSGETIFRYTVSPSWSDEPNDNAVEKLKQLFGVRKNMAFLLLCCLGNLNMYFPVGLKIVKLFTYVQKNGKSLVDRETHHIWALPQTQKMENEFTTMANVFWRFWHQTPSFAPQ